MRLQQVSGTFNVEIITKDEKVIPKTKYILLKIWYTIVMYFFKIIASLFCDSWDKETTYYRKLRVLELVYVNQIAKNWYCNHCGNLVFKGALKKGSSVLMNCPHCLSVYQVSPDFYGKLSRRTACVAKDNPRMVTEDFTIDNGIRYGEKICGVEYFIKEKDF